MEPRLQVQNLTKSYPGTGAAAPRRAVDGLSLEIAPGEILGLLGPNGAGKTSALECIIGLREPDAGEIRICGLNARRQPGAAREKFGAALQATALQDVITPREALQLFGSFYRKPASIPALLERFSLVEKAGAYFHTLSGGQRQRLALALAFVNQPELLFLDEPTSGLDPQSRRDLHQSIRQFREEGRSVLLTTHYIEEAHALCDRIAVIDRGRMIATGTPDELITSSAATPRILVRTAPPLPAGALPRLDGVTATTTEGETLALHTTRVGPVIIELVRHLEATGHELLDLQVKKPSLEDVFLELTHDPGA